MTFAPSIALFLSTGLLAMTAFGKNTPQNAPRGSSHGSAAGNTTRQAALPKDIDPQSMARIPLPRRDKMDERGKKMYDLIVSPKARSLAGLQGPYGIWLHSPRLAELAQPLNYYLRYETSLGRRLTELAILVTARELNSQFEWTAHEPAALKAGLEPKIIDVVRYRRSPKGLSEKEALIIRFGRELFGKRKVSSQTFARLLKTFGQEKTVNLAALMGDYASINAIITTFDIQLRPGQKPLLPMP